MCSIQDVEQHFKNTEQNLRNLINSVFRLEYRKIFKQKRTVYIPTLNEYLDDPSNLEKEKEFYEFFETFKYLYI